MNAAVGLFKTARPRQWVKNLLVFLPCCSRWTWSGRPATWQRCCLRSQLAVLFAAFCALSSAVYILNDFATATRPTASNQAVPPHRVGRRASARWPGPRWPRWPPAGWLGCTPYPTPRTGYWPSSASSICWRTSAYSLRLKSVALVDVMLVAAGYVLRAVAGAVAVGATPSPWLYAVTAAGALVIRHRPPLAEARLAGPRRGRPAPHPATLRPPGRRPLLVLSATAALVSYALYAVEADNLPDNNTMLLTVPLVIFACSATSTDQQQPRRRIPEMLMLRDIPLLASIAAWVIVAGAGAGA